MNTLQILSSLLLAPLVYVVIGIYYRLRLHPLARFPGPTWAGVTDWWELYQEVNGNNFFLKLDLWHAKYGTILKIGDWPREKFRLTF